MTLTPDPLRRRLLLASSAAAAAAGVGFLPASSRASSLGCPSVGQPTEINVVGNSFPVVAHVARIAEACTRPGSKVRFKLTPQARIETEQAYASRGASPFDAAVVSMAVFGNLYARRQLAPLTALVDKYRDRYRIEERMLVRVDGEVMAIAFIQNTQNLYYRADLLTRHGLAVPDTYAAMVQVAQALKAAEPTLAHPIAQSFAGGYDIATEFTNVLSSLGGRYFAAGSLRPAFDDAAGVAAVETMRSLLPQMTPNALASNADDVVNQFQQGKAALGVLWASRAARMDDPAASRVVGLMQFAPAPAARARGTSAAHLWWDGVAFPANAPARREATFQVLMEALGEASVRSGNDLAIWVRSAYRPGRLGAGVALQQKAGSPEWPSDPGFSLAHGELGKVLPDAMIGRRSPRAALADAAAAYTRAAVEKGILSAGAAT